MTQATVRAGIQAYLESLDLPGVAAIFPGIPTFVESVAWQLSPGTDWSAVLCINLDRWEESRLTIGAPNPALPQQAVGLKQRDYEVSIVVQQQYMEVENNGDPTRYVGMIDTLLEAIVAGIHADPTLGTGGNPIQEAGQDAAGLSVEMEVPQQTADGTALYAWNRIAFKLTEILNA